MKTAEQRAAAAAYQRSWNAARTPEQKARAASRDAAWYAALSPEQKDALAAKSRALRRDDPAWHARELARRHRPSVALRAAAQHRVRRYGLTPEALSALLETQGRVCAICPTAIDGGSRTHVDHDHLTDMVRGLLCGPCNRGLGYFRENRLFLASAHRYLSRDPFVVFSTSVAGLPTASSIAGDALAALGNPTRDVSPEGACGETRPYPEERRDVVFIQ